jgi:predicted RNA binding protein YcfA (HicA-like mRNA interferase family)
MPTLNPVSRRELVRKLRALGFEGSFPGGKHEWMRREKLRVTIPNSHAGAIDPGLIRRILRQAGITVEAWLNA